MGRATEMLRRVIANVEPNQSKALETSQCSKRCGHRVKLVECLWTFKSFHRYLGSFHFISGKQSIADIWGFMINSHFHAYFDSLAAFDALIQACQLLWEMSVTFRCPRCWLVVAKTLLVAILYLNKLSWNCACWMLMDFVAFRCNVQSYLWLLTNGTYLMHCPINLFFLSSLQSLWTNFTVVSTLARGFLDMYGMGYCRCVWVLPDCTGSHSATCELQQRQNNHSKELVGDECNYIGSSQLFLISTRGWRIWGSMVLYSFCLTSEIYFVFNKDVLSQKDILTIVLEFRH